MEGPCSGTGAPRASILWVQCLHFLPPLDSVYWSRLSLARLVLYSMSLLEGPALSTPSLQGTHTKSHLQEAQVVLQPH